MLCSFTIHLYQVYTQKQLIAAHGGSACNPSTSEAWIQGQLVLNSVNTFKLIILLPKIVRFSSFHLLQVHVFFFNRCFKWKFSVYLQNQRQQSENCHTDICIFIKHLSNWQKWLPNSTMRNSIWSNNLINATYQIGLYNDAENLHIWD